MKQVGKSIILVLALALISAFVIAQPTPLDGVDVVGSERKSTGGTGTAVQSEAGNLTQLDVNGSAITGNWQGYYGNITGEITLDDANSNTLYAWNLISPTGEIYATNNSGTVSWSNVTCVNLTNATSDSLKINETTLNQQYFIPETSIDKFNETFTTFFSGSFDVGGVTIDSTDNCYQTHMYVNNASQSTDYSEVLLFDNHSSLIFTTIIEPTATVGFDGSQWNFEMLVAQNNETVGNYYFYVELS